MEFADLIKSRRSVRAYLSKEIEEGKLMKLLNMVNSAPSAGNLQAYHIHVVQNEDSKQELQAACMDQEYVSQASVVLVFSADKATAASKYEERGTELYSVQDATIAATYAQLAATDLDLASVWIGAFDPLEVSRIISLPPDMVPVAIIPIGYAAEEPKESSRKSVLKMVTEV